MPLNNTASRSRNACGTTSGRVISTALCSASRRRSVPNHPSSRRSRCAGTLSIRARLLALPMYSKPSPSTKKYRPVDVSGVGATRSAKVTSPTVFATRSTIARSSASGMSCTADHSMRIVAPHCVVVRIHESSGGRKVRPAERARRASVALVGKQLLCVVCARRRAPPRPLTLARAARRHRARRARSSGALRVNGSACWSTAVPRQVGRQHRRPGVRRGRR